MSSVVGDDRHRGRAEARHDPAGKERSRDHRGGDSHDQGEEQRGAEIGVQTGDGGATIGPALGTDAAGLNGFSGLIICSANLPDKIAISVDAQMDDGVSTTGTVRSVKQDQPNDTLGAAQGADTYSEDGVSTYLVCRQM